MPVFSLIALAPALKVADLRGSKGCMGLNLDLLTFAGGQPICFAIGDNAESLLNGTNNTSVLGFYNGFFLPDSDAMYHRLFQQFADQLWARNFNATSVQTFNVNSYRCK